MSPISVSAVNNVKEFHIFYFVYCWNASRFVTQLLADVTYFVADQENSGGDPLEVSVTKPDRERQKLLREQNILKQVGFHCIFL